MEPARGGKSDTYSRRFSGARVLSLVDHAIDEIPFSAARLPLGETTQELKRSIFDFC